MRRPAYTKIIAFALICLLLAACSSSRNVNMRKHRRSRHCDCPTFGQRIDGQANSHDVYFPEANTL